MKIDLKKLDLTNTEKFCLRECCNGWETAIEIARARWPSSKQLWLKEITILRCMIRLIKLKLIQRSPTQPQFIATDKGRACVIVLREKEAERAKS